MKENISALDAYTNRVYKIIVLIIPIFCLCASVTITILHYIGIYRGLNETAIWLFDLSDIIYLAVGIYFIRTGFGVDGIVLPKKLNAGKYTMAIIVIIQWNEISYIWPFRDLWAFALLFTIVEAFFFDVKLVGITTFGISISILISWFVNGDRLLPPADEYFIYNRHIMWVRLFRI